MIDKDKVAKEIRDKRIIEDEKLEEDIKVTMAKTPTLVHKFIRVYNRLCRKCKVKAHKNPGMPFNEYCSMCQGKARRIIG